MDKLEVVDHRSCHLWLKAFSDYPRVWIATDYEGRHTGALVALTADDARQLRDYLDRWLADRAAA